MGIFYLKILVDELINMLVIKRLEIIEGKAGKKEEVIKLYKHRPPSSAGRVLSCACACGRGPGKGSPSPPPCLYPAPAQAEL